MFGITAFAQSPFAALGGVSYAVNLAETFTSTDVYGGSVAFSGITAESFALSDSDGTATFNFYVNITESFNADTEQNNVSVYPVSLLEGFSLTTELEFGYLYFVDVEDFVTLEDTPNVSSLFTSAVSETLTVSEDLTGGFYYGVDVPEDITLTETQTVQTDFGPTVAETVTVNEEVLSNAIFNPSMLETMTLTDAPIGRGWFRIVDDQNPNWTPINNNQ